MTKLGAHPVSPVIVAVQEEVVVVGSVIIPVISPDENGVDAPTIIHSVDTSSPHAATPLLAQPFPRWGSSNDSNNKGIDLPTLLDFTRGLLRKEATTVQGKKSRARFPETLYILDPKQGAVWSSQTTRARTWNVMIKARVEPTERLFAAAARLLLALPDRSGPYINEDETETVESSQTWPHLRQAATAGHSVPFFVWYGDYKDCNHLNWKGEHSIPLFTT